MVAAIQGAVLIALAAGAGSFTLVRGYAAEIEALRPATGDVVPVVVAGDDSLAAVIEEDAVRLERILPTRRRKRSERSRTPWDGRWPRTSRKGRPSPRRGWAATADRSRRSSRAACALRGGSGLPSDVLEPGDRVDVIATFGGPRPYTDTVGSGLEILSVVEQDEETFQAGGATGPSLVLLVSPETAEQLAHAAAFGQITVTTRRSTRSDEPGASSERG